VTERTKTYHYQQWTCQ